MPSKAALHPEYYNCRFYENKFPNVDELVVVLVKRVADMGAYVSLMEYNNIEGMIMQTEYSRRRIKSVAKLLRVGKQEVVVVLRVDPVQGYIDLSKRRVSPQEALRAEERFNKSKAVHSIMRHLAETKEISLEKLYQMCVWPLVKKYGHAYDAFKAAIGAPEKVFESELNIPADILSDLTKLIARRLTPLPVKARADVDVTCFEYEGIDAIKAALRAGEACSTQETPIQIKLLAPPTFVMFTTALEKQAALNELGAAIDKIREEITQRKGELVVRNPPRVISEREESELAKELKGEESGSEESEESEEEEQPKEKQAAAPAAPAVATPAESAAPKPVPTGVKPRGRVRN
eukprot:TRINITY_DN1374_c1_g1_i1.p1 TRINITY_DN1374_c1_g1~~TRINITY_DN1374_c1_g1_i1.p1  ORF type:complete len:380 (-),score=144.23 TRINITY_DN1374_c1_g1_i1:197-1243(-)